MKQKTRRVGIDCSMRHDDIDFDDDVHEKNRKEIIYMQSHA
jgi:hypothetical protein